MDHLSTLQLKRKCAELGLHQQGLRASLIQRLQQHTSEKTLKVDTQEEEGSDRDSDSDSDNDDFQRLSTSELKIKCEQLALSPKGMRSTLLERLQRNSPKALRTVSASIIAQWGAMPPAAQRSASSRITSSLQSATATSSTSCSEASPSGSCDATVEPSPIEQLKRLSTIQLQRRCEKLSLSPDGIKSTLIRRLQRHMPSNVGQLVAAAPALEAGALSEGLENEESDEESDEGMEHLSVMQLRNKCRCGVAVRSVVLQ